MERYEVEITEIYRKTVVVEAESADDAEAQVDDKIGGGKIRPEVDYDEYHRELNVIKND